MIPTAFAGNIDADVVEMNNELAVDDISLPATDDVAVETVSADYDESASDESDVLEANDYENDVITAGDDAIYVDGFDGSGVVVLLAIRIIHLKTYLPVLII